MADNFTANPGAGGDTFAADDVGGIKYPYSKIDVGADGVSSPVTAANPLPISLPASQIAALAPLATQPISAAILPLPTGAASEATLAAMNAKVPALGQAVSASSMPVVIASNQSPIPTVENATVLTGAAAQTAVVNNILESAAGANATDVTNQRAAVIQVVSTGTGGTFIFEQSNDNVNFRPLPVFNAELVTATAITTAITATASQIIYTFPIRGRFIRLRIASTITGGSIQAFSRISTEPWTAATQMVASPTAANFNANVSGTVTATVTSITGGTISPLTVAGASVEASSAKTAAGNGATLTNANARGGTFFINVSAVSGTTPTLAVRLQWQDPVSLAWADIPGAVTASISTVSLTTLEVYPGVAEVANIRVSRALPRTCRLAWTIGGTTPSFTFSVGFAPVI